MITRPPAGDSPIRATLPPPIPCAPDTGAPMWQRGDQYDQVWLRIHRGELVLAGAFRRMPAASATPPAWQGAEWFRPGIPLVEHIGGGTP